MGTSYSIAAGMNHGPGITYNPHSAQKERIKIKPGAILASKLNIFTLHLCTIEASFLVP